MVALMADVRHTASHSETNTCTVLEEPETEKSTPARQLSAEDIAALAAFFDLLDRWDKSLSKTKPQN